MQKQDVSFQRDLSYNVHLFVLRWKIFSRNNLPGICQNRFMTSDWTFLWSAEYSAQSVLVNSTSWSPIYYSPRGSASGLFFCLSCLSCLCYQRADRRHFYWKMTVISALAKIRYWTAIANIYSTPLQVFKE